MKRLFISFIMMLTMTTAVQANELEQQTNNADEPKGWDIQVMGILQHYADSLVGKNMKALYDFMTYYEINPKHWGGSDTSPWIDPEGKMYVRDITYYSETLEDMLAGKKYFVITAVVDTDKVKIDFKDLMKSYSKEKDGNYIKGLIRASMGLPIKKVTVRWERFIPATVKHEQFEIP